MANLDLGLISKLFSIASRRLDKFESALRDDEDEDVALRNAELKSLLTKSVLNHDQERDEDGGSRYEKEE